MGREWRATTIGGLLSTDGGSVKTGPFGTILKAKEYSDVGVPLVSVREIGYGSLRVHEKTPRAPREVVARLPEYLLEAGDIVFGRKGAVDRLALVKPSQTGWFLGSDGIRLRLPKTCDSRFVAYQLQCVSSRLWLLHHATGTTMASLNQKIIERVPIELPALEEQRTIGKFFGRMDEKIELNRRMNETLKEVARAIFKDWFVDFGPTRAKAEGRAPYLAPDLWNLFPDALDNEEKPLDWEISEIGKEVNAVGGATPSTKEPSFWEGGDFHWATPKDLSNLTSPVLLETHRKITKAGVRKISSGLLPIGTLLMSSRAPIGYLAIAEVPTAVNQGFIAMVCEKRLPNVFVLFWCYENLDHFKGIAGGSTFSEISKRVFRPIPIVVPSERIVEEFERLVRPLYSRIVSNMKESELLAQTRDYLLPKLMSGEIRVSDAEKAVEAAG